MEGLNGALPPGAFPPRAQALARLTADRALAQGLLRPAAAEGLLNALGGRP